MEQPLTGYFLVQCTFNNVGQGKPVLNKATRVNKEYIYKFSVALKVIVYSIFFSMTEVTTAQFSSLIIDDTI